jgi:hypothetical protein
MQQDLGVHSGDMRRPIGYTHPIPAMHVSIKGVRAQDVRPATGAAVAFDNGEQHVTLCTGLDRQYEVLIIGMDGIA